MARKITIKLSGLAEKFIVEMGKQGLSEADVISQGLGMLEEVWRTNRVALVREEYKRGSEKLLQATNHESKAEILEFFYQVQTPVSMKPDRFNDKQIL